MKKRFLIGAVAALGVAGLALAQGVTTITVPYVSTVNAQDAFLDVVNGSPGGNNKYASALLMAIYFNSQNWGSTPALTACGTAPSIAGTDLSGTVTMGTGSPTGCVITFASTRNSAPTCLVTWHNTPLASQSYSVTATALTLVQTGTSSDVVSYYCPLSAGN